MKDDSMKIEQRLQNMKNFYTKVGDLLDNLPDAIPEKARQKIRDTILGDEELKNLMDGVDSHRPPRIFLKRVCIKHGRNCRCRLWLQTFGATSL